jgi:hypothetical protein
VIAPVEAPLTRRQVLEALAALALAALPLSSAGAAASPSPAATAAGGASLTAADLVAAAAVLDGAPLLDDALGATFLAELARSAGAEKLARLAEVVRSTPPDGLDRAIASAGLEPAARQVVAAFYSGLVGSAADEKLVTYLFALVWGAAPFTKPPSLCGGLFGYWADPPPGAASGTAAT